MLFVFVIKIVKSRPTETVCGWWWIFHFQTNHSSFCAVVTIVVDVVVWDKLGSNCLIFNKSLDAKCVGVRWPSTIFVVCTRVCSQGDASFPTTMPLCVNAIYAWISLIHSCRLLLIWNELSETWKFWIKTIYYPHLHWIWFSDEFGLWRHMHIIKPAKTAPIAKKQLTDIRTNHVNSKPSNVVDLLSENNIFFFYFNSNRELHLEKNTELYWKKKDRKKWVDLLWQRLSSELSPQWFTSSQTKSGWMHSSRDAHKNDWQTCSIEENKDHLRHQ